MERALASEITLKAGETPALPFTRNAPDKRFAAEASKNLENAESNSDLLDRGCVSRRRNFYHKETIAYRFA